MSQKDINELHKIIVEWAIDRGYETNHLLAFLSITFVGTMVMHGYSEEFFDKTCERMKNNFKKHMKSMENERKDFHQRLLEIEKRRK